MNDFARRDVIAAVAGLVAVTGALADCTTTGTLDPQVLADVQGLQSASQALMAAVTQYDPGAISASTQATITALAGTATAALTSLTSATPIPTATSPLQKIDAYINEVLQAIGSALPVASAAFPVLLPFVPIYDAGVALLSGVVEPYLNSILTQVGVAPKPAAKYHEVKAHFTAPEARTILRIPNLHTAWS